MDMLAKGESVFLHLFQQYEFSLSKWLYGAPDPTPDVTGPQAINEFFFFDGYS